MKSFFKYKCKSFLFTLMKTNDIVRPDRTKATIHTFLDHK